MAHPLRNILSIDVDSSPKTGWPGGFAKLAAVRIEDRPIKCFFVDPRGYPEQDGSTTLVTKATMQQIRDLGVLPGLRMDPVHYGYPNLTAGGCASFFSNQIELLQPAVVEYDVENKDLRWQVELLLGTIQPNGQWTKGLRGAGGHFPDPAFPETLGYRWGRPFVWTFEGRQSPGTNAAATAAQAGGLIGPQPYNGAMTEWWDLWWEIKTWVRGAKVPLEQLLAYYDADKEHRPGGVSEAVLFATSRCTELLA